MKTFVFRKSVYPSLCVEEVLNLDEVESFWPQKDKEENDVWPYRITLRGVDSTIFFSDEADRNRAFNDMATFCKQQNINTPMNKTLDTVTTDVKGFVKDHRQIIYYTVLALLIDHFFLNGQLTAKIKNIMQGLLTKAEETITGKKAVVEVPVATEVIVVK